VFLGDEADQKLRELTRDRQFPHRAAVGQAIRFRAGGDVADLVAVLDDPDHPCGMNQVLFALGGAQRLWLSLVPMPTERIAKAADHFAPRVTEGETMGRITLPVAEPPSAIAAFRRIIGPRGIDVAEFPEPDVRRPIRSGRYRVWRYDGVDAVPAVAAPSAEAGRVLHQVGSEPWGSPFDALYQAGPLGGLSLDDLLGLLVHPPAAPAGPRWEFLGRDSPSYWFRFLQPWVCLGLLHHAADEPWESSVRREALIDLAFGVEDWVSDSALFALVAQAYVNPEFRPEAHRLVRDRLDAAVAAAAGRTVTIADSLARLMLVTPGCTTDDRAVARAAGAHDDAGTGPARRRRWWGQKR
jgi:hypothetical protein